MNDGNRRLYRSRNGMILGVCRGLAERFEMSVFWTRVAAVVLLLCTGAWPILGIYFGAAFFMQMKPVRPIESEEEQEFYDSYSHSSRMALHRLKRTYERLNRRIQRMEHTVTASEYDWDHRLNEQS